MPSIQATHRSNSTAQRLFALLIAVLVTSSFLAAGTLGSVTASPTSESHSPPAIEAGGNSPAKLDSSNAVDNNAVVITEDGNVVSGELVSHGEPVGRVIRTYDVNGLEKTEPVETRGGNVVSASGKNIVVEGGGSVGKFDENPDIRARYENGTVEKLVVDGRNIETTSGQNIVTEDGENVAVDQDAFSEANFIVAITGTERVGEGEIMNVTADVGNNGHAEGEKRIEVVVDGRSHNPKLLRLDPGETRQVEFRYRTSSGDAPEIELKVKTPDDVDTTTATVAKPDFQLGISESELGVSAGETINVPVHIGRTGGSSKETYATDFIVDGTVIDTELVTLSRGGSANLKFSYDTTEEDTPSVLATIRGPNNLNDTMEIPIHKQILAVDSIQTPTNISEHEQVNVTATLENYGTETKNQTVSLEFSENGTDETTVVGEKQVSVSKRNTKDVTFSYETTPELHPNHQLTVRTADHNRTTTIATNATAVFQIESAPSGNITAPADGGYSLAATVKNAGHASGAKNVTFSVNGTVKKTVTPSLDTGETSSVSVGVDVPTDNPASFKIATEDDSSNGALLAEGAASGDQSNSSANSGSEPSPANNGNGGGSGMLSFLPSIPIMITTTFSVILVGVIAHIAS